MRIHLLFSLLLSITPLHFPLLIPMEVTAEEPSYAKWGRLAMVETKKKHPRAEIIDYQHVGRTPVTGSVSQEVFKLWLREGHREWGVLVTIQFESQSGKFRTIHFQETS